MNLILIFITGLTVGGLTCLAVQGGLLASVIAAREEKSTKNRRRHVLISTAAFLIAKLAIYTLFGFILGAFGGAINIGGKVQTLMQLAAGIYMIVIALNLFEVHPIFRYAVIQPPRFLTKRVKSQSKSKDIFAPALLGLMTVFIPCGTTIAMEALAISSASPLKGALIMFAFMLGTVPLFFGLGFITSLLGDAFKAKFFKFAALLVMILGIMSINGALVAFGFPLTINSAVKSIKSLGNSDSNKPKMSVAYNQNPEIAVTSSGYSPNFVTVKKGLPVTLKLVGKDAYSCATAFRIPSLGIAVNLKSANDVQIIKFTPMQSGEIPFTCVMGMYTGVIKVI